jgi:hypothetical protein
VPWSPLISSPAYVHTLPRSPHLAISWAVDYKIRASDEKRKILRMTNDPEIDALLTEDPRETTVHLSNPW